MTPSRAPTENRSPPPDQWPSIELIQEIVAGVLDHRQPGETAADVGLQACQRLDRLLRAHRSGPRAR
jgi:hypothetical protein